MERQEDIITTDLSIEPLIPQSDNSIEVIVYAG